MRSAIFGFICLLVTFNAWTQQDEITIRDAKFKKPDGKWVSVTLKLKPDRTKLRVIDKKGNVIYSYPPKIRKYMETEEEASDNPRFTISPSAEKFRKKLTVFTGFLTAVTGLIDAVEKVRNEEKEGYIAGAAAFTIGCILIDYKEQQPVNVVSDGSRDDVELILPTSKQYLFAQQTSSTILFPSMNTGSSSKLNVGLSPKSDGFAAAISVGF